MNENLKMYLTVAEKLRRLKSLMREEELNSLWSLYQLEDNPRAKREIESWIDTMFLEKSGSGFDREIILPPPARNESYGDLKVGDVTYCGKTLFPFGLHKDELMRHMGLFGQTGSGKTTACMNLLKHFLKAKIPFVIFDWKRNYRDLLTDPDFEKEEILIFTVGRDVSPFRFNPKIAPPGIESHIWAKKLIEIIEKAYLLGPGASDVLIDAMSFPTFAEMKRYVDKQHRRGREMLWHSSAKRTLNSLTFPGLNEVVNCDSQIPIEELLTKNVILELDGLSDTDKTFIIGSLLLWIYFYRMQEPEREVLKHVIVIEEAHHLLLRTNKEEDITDVMMREIRELGEGIVILDQHPHKISVSALGNVYTRIGFQTSLSQDISSLGKSMLIPIGNEEFFGMLKIGEAIVKSGRVPFPFQIKVPKLNIIKGIISDKVIKDRMASISPYSDQNEFIKDYSSSFHEVPKLETLSPTEAIFLEDISLNPLTGVKHRYKKLGLNPRDGTALMDSLMNKRLIAGVTVERNRLFDITMHGRDVMREHGLKLENSRVRGGVEHNYWLKKIQSALAGQTRVYLEKDDIDLVAKWDETKIAVQVETGKSDIKKNIETLKNYEAGRKFMIATNPGALTKIQSLITGSFVQSYLAKDFIEKIIPIILTEN